MHPVFAHPPNKDAKIWRYMDFTKYISMLEHRGLYLCRADLLGDPFEGSVPKKSLELFRHMLMRAQFAEATFQTMSDFRKGLRKEIYLNCWHASDFESAAMWNLYSKSNEAIAVQSSFFNLFNCIESDEKSSPFYVGLVNYIDYAKDIMELENTLWPFVHKRKSFQHENEIRVVHNYPTKPGESWGQRETPLGVWKDVELERLISRIYVSPSSEPWFRELVEKATKRYGLNYEIQQSDINAAPMF